MSFWKDKLPGEYPPFFIDPFKRKDNMDVNRRWHVYGVRATVSMMERMEKTMKKNMKTFTKKTVKRIGMEDIRTRRQNLILAWIDPRRCNGQNKQRKE